MAHHIILRVEFEGFGVPYYRREDDPTSKSYIDLKQEPERSAELPEVKDWPELKTAIDKINAHRLFKTLGCAAWVYETDSPERIKFVSYLAFCFAPMELNKDALSYYRLFHQFCLLLSERTLPENLAMHFVVRQTGFNGGELAMGFSGELGLSGYGSSVEQARTLPNLAFSLLTDLLEKF